MIESTVTRSPPILRTMSAKTVVVATIRRAPDGVLDDPCVVPPLQAVKKNAAAASTASRVKPSMDTPHGRRRRVVRGMASGRGGGGGRPVQAGGTQPEELEPMIVDAVARPPGDVRDDGPQALVVDLVR